VALGLRTGKDAWIGWPQSSKMEELRAAWIDSTDDGARRTLATAIQEEGLAVVVYIPLGRYIQPSAWRRNITGILTSNAPLFWNVRRS
jgi:peptide/nickel transport system substrate-binding protein